MMVKNFFLEFLERKFGKFARARRWAQKSLVVGPAAPVDGDSVASVVALIRKLRELGKQAYTLPTLVTYPQIKWILARTDFHPSSTSFMDDLVTSDLQAFYDSLIKEWLPDEILLVDGCPSRLGFDTRNVRLFQIDHHVEGLPRDDHDAYVQYAPSTGALLIEHYGIYDPVLTVSLLTDTYWLRKNFPAQAAKMLALLVLNGMTDIELVEIQRKLMPQKSPAVLAAIHSADLLIKDNAVFVLLRTDSPNLHREAMGLFGYYATHICVARADGYVSLSTADPSIDLAKFARRFAGGGHQSAARANLPPLAPGSGASDAEKAAAIEQLSTAFFSFIAADKY